MTADSADTAADNKSENSVTVYYDGACPLCRREIGMYQGLTGANDIAWVDVSACEPSNLPENRSKDDLLRRFHVQAEDGTLKDGAAAFFEVWRKLPAFAWAAPIRHIPFVVTIADYVYSGFLKVRPHIQRLLRA